MAPERPAAAAAAAASPPPSLGRPARLVSIIDQEMRQESMRQLSVYRPCKGRQRQKLSRGCLLGCARALRLPTDAAWKPAAFLSVCSLADCLKLCKVLRGVPQQVRGYRQAIHRCPRCLTPFDYQHISCLDPPDHLTGRGGPADTDLFAILQSMRATLQEYCDNQILIHLEPPQGQLQEALRKYSILDAAIYAGQYEATLSRGGFICRNAIFRLSAISSPCVEIEKPTNCILMLEKCIFVGEILRLFSAHASKIALSVLRKPSDVSLANPISSM